MKRFDNKQPLRPEHTIHNATNDVRQNNVVQLPAAPQSTSPVPWLTSLHAHPDRGPYGDPRYRGNCSGILIRDLLQFFRPRSVWDPMTGSGTCADVCRELGIACDQRDLRSGYDAAAANSVRGQRPVEFVWLHPPYWSLIRYSDDSRCLSNAPTLEEFAQRLSQVVRNTLEVLTKDGHLAILMGDLRKQGRYCGLPFVTYQVAVSAGLELAAPEIIRFSHGATSARLRYPFPLIPRLHEICFVFRRRRAKPGG